MSFRINLYGVSTTHKPTKTSPSSKISASAPASDSLETRFTLHTTEYEKGKRVFLQEEQGMSDIKKDDTNEAAHSPSQLDSLEKRRLLTAKHIMSTPAVTVMPHELVTKVNAIMKQFNISQVIVVNNDHRPIGTVGAKELLKVDSPETSFVQNIFTARVLAVSTDALVREIALNFIKYKTSVFAVINDEKQVIGIISRSDLLKLLVSSPLTSS